MKTLIAILVSLIAGCAFAAGALAVLDEGSARTPFSLAAGTVVAASVLIFLLRGAAPQEASAAAPPFPPSHPAQMSNTLDLSNRWTNAPPPEETAAAPPVPAARPASTATRCSTATVAVLPHDHRERLRDAQTARARQRAAARAPVSGQQLIGGVVLLVAVFAFFFVPGIPGILIAGFAGVIATLFLLLPPLARRGD